MAKTSRVPTSVSVRLVTEDTPTLGEEWERLTNTYGMDGAAFIRQAIKEIVRFEHQHKRLPRLAGLTIQEGPAST